MEYRVIYHTDLDRFVKAVHDAMADGWLPQGGMSAYGGVFYQAMIRIGHERVAVKATAQPAVALG